MKRLQRITAFLLCIIMMFPAQAMPVLADTLIPETSLEGFSETEEELIEEELTEEETDRINETLPLDELTEESEHINEILPLDELTEETEHINETLPLEELTEGETNHISETLPLESLDDGAGILAGEALELEEYEDGVIYWNPGGTLPEVLEADSDASTATDSDAEKASPSIARRGSDSASGRSAKAPVKSLKTALKRAKQLQEEGFDPSEITIYAMNPMEIADGQLYVLNASGVNITSWSERAYDSDAIFYVNGGQLTIMNLSLESGNPEQDPELAELIYVKGGTLQIGEYVSVNGRIVMDYRNGSEGMEPEHAYAEEEAEDQISSQKEERIAESDGDTDTADTTIDEVPVSIEADTTEADTLKTDTKEIDTETSASDIQETTEETVNNKKTENTLKVRIRKTDSKNAGIVFFDINDYTIETDEETIQLIRDTKSASTWREPIIELVDGFDGSGGSYLLDVRGDNSIEQIELARTLYADEYSEEEFMELFRLVETEEETWSLSAASEEEAQIRDTSRGASLYSAIMAVDEEEESDELDFIEVLTRKTLIATQNSTGTTVYWNPGDKISTVADNNAGNDTSDGNSSQSPVRTWKRAADIARGGTIICMQSVDLSDENASKFIGEPIEGKYIIKSPGVTSRATLRPWGSNRQPAFIVPAGSTLVLEDIILSGQLEGASDEVMVDCKRGDVIIGNNVHAEKGYISVETFDELENHPIKVSNISEEDNDPITLFFKGINE